MTFLKQPKQKTSPGKKLLMFIGVVALVLIIGSALSNNDKTKDTVSNSNETKDVVAAREEWEDANRAETQKDAKAETQKDDGGSIGKTVEAWVAAMDFVKRELKAPSTAKFIGHACSPYVVYLGDDRYLVRAAVDAQNSFGAMIRTEFRVVVRDKRDSHQTWTLEEINI